MFKVSLSRMHPSGASREQGRIARLWLRGLIDLHQQVTMNLDGVQSLTPSFVDECFGKLLVEMGEDKFRTKLVLQGGSPAVRTLLNKVLRIRLAEARPGNKESA